ncbi:MAG: HAD-IB family hydrolase [Pseudomonadota bacterium]
MPTRALEHHLSSIQPSSTDAPVVAFFDLDRTLISGYSIIAMARERVRHGLNRGDLLGSAAILRELVRQQRSLESGDTGSSYHRLVKKLTKSLAGIREETLTRLGEQAYQNSIARSLYSEAIALVEAHRNAGHKLVIVTAATRYQVEPIANVLGVDDICCSGLEVQGGKFTGRTLAPLCYGEGKALAARRACREFGATLNRSWFYSDSIDDLPLLKKVGNPVAVNPSEKLSVHAEKKGWRRLNFETRGTPSIEALIRTTLTLQTVAATTTFCALGKRVGLGELATAQRIAQVVGGIGSTFAGIDLEVEGSGHLKHAGPAVYIFNHQSMLDIMVLARLLQRSDVVALCKQEMASNPLVGAMLKQAGTIFVDREDTEQTEVLRSALAVLASGRSLIIAPEGTRSTLGEIQPFKHGAFYLAKKARVPVIPIVLHNVKDALPNGGMLIRPATIRATVLAPIKPSAMGSIRQACESMERSYSRVMGSSEVASLPATLKRSG